MSAFGGKADAAASAIDPKRTWIEALPVLVERQSSVAFRLIDIP